VRAIVYMSCGHESFMMDADRLTGEDASLSHETWGPPFRLISVRCYDMFPFTPHIETLGIFVRDAVDSSSSGCYLVTESYGPGNRDTVA